MASSLSVPKAFFLAARPRTWIASISPVLIGASFVKGVNGPLLLCTLLFALFIQIGTNFANDAFDFLKGADTDERKGPPRAVQQGWISVQGMFWATALVFGAALVAALPLIAMMGAWAFALSLLCVAFGVLYTGGPKPLGYLGLGEVLVLVFFGPVATCGTYYVQTLQFHPAVFLASLAPGLLSCSLIVANNLRDWETDKKANKRTLIVRFGQTFGRWEYVGCIELASLVPILLVTLCGAPLQLGLLSLISLLAFPLLQRAMQGSDFVPLLQGSGMLLWGYTLAFCLLNGI